MNLPIIHKNAEVQSTTIGAGTRIWQFCVILEKAHIGECCNICSHVFIENDVVIGDRVTVKCGVQLWDGVHVEDDVFIGPNVTFTNDPFPRSRQIPSEYSKTIIHRGASIGANATILPGISIGRYAMIAAGAVVTRDVPAYAIVKGNPGRISGYTHEKKEREKNLSKATLPEVSMSGVSFVNLIQTSDMRGDLLVAELQKHIPFEVKRLFFVMNVPTHHVRGEHAHKQCHQLLVCLQGEVTVIADNGSIRQEWVLNRADLGLHLHPMTWGIQYRYSKNAVLAVFASHSYDPNDYIRDYGTT